MTDKKKTRFGHKVIIAVRFVMAGMGLVSATTTTFSATSFTQASTENTVQSYTNFILHGGSTQDIDRAFCQLRDLDQGAADHVAVEYERSSNIDEVDFASCGPTGHARLLII